MTWCPPLVVQPKPRYSKVSKDSLEPHMIGASVDLRVLNKQMERNRISQSPVVEDFTCKFHDCTIFSKMDLKQGYHQLVLHQVLFDKVMYRIFGDIPHCLNQRDDILIGGTTIAEHNKTLETVLQ